MGEQNSDYFETRTYLLKECTSTKEEEKEVEKVEKQDRIEGWIEEYINKDAFLFVLCYN